MNAITAQSNAQFDRRALTRAVLAETAKTPLIVPQLKTPLIERAKVAGAAHREAQDFATQVIARMQKRAAATLAKIDEKAAEVRAHARALVEVAQGIATGQGYYMQQTSDATIAAALVAAGLKQNKATVSQVRTILLRHQVRVAFEGEFRTCKNGITTIKLGSAAAFEQVTRTDWSLYRGQFKGWAAHITDTTITVRPDYWMRVIEAIGSAFVGNCLVLDAKPARSKHLPVAAKAYKGTWVVQGRGNQASAVAGYILVTPTGKTSLAAEINAASVKSAMQAA